MVLGLALGLGSALLGEFSKSCFRNTSDISRVLVVPVLGVVSPIVTRVQKRRQMLRRFAVGSMSLLLIGSVLFVTWAWVEEPTLLGDRMNESIETFRGLFLEGHWPPRNERPERSAQPCGTSSSPSCSWR